MCLRLRLPRCLVLSLATGSGPLIKSRASYKEDKFGKPYPSMAVPGICDNINVKILGAVSERYFVCIFIVYIL